METPEHTPTPCSVCEATDSIPFFEMEEVPAHVGLQWPTREKARQCPRGTIKLCFCPQCGHVYNAAFDPALMEYSEDYDNSLYYSPRFQQYSREVAEHLVEHYDLHEKDIIEIGCGKGDFLLLLAQLGNNRAVGFDPSYEPDRIVTEAAQRVTFIQDFYSERYAEYQADLICSRYVFEHIPDPIDFLAMVRRAAGQTRPVVYFEVPNVALILRDLSIWDIIYEHCSSFSAESLAYAFARAGFRVHDLYEGYDGQFLGIEATPLPASASPSLPQATPARRDGHAALHQQVRTFQTHFTERRAAWRHNLEYMQRAGARVVLWGAGARAVSFMSLLEANGPTGIDYVVDINPMKHGHFLAGGGQEIVSPDFLTTYRPNVVIIMNQIYKDEIQRMLNEMGVAADLLCAMEPAASASSDEKTAGLPLTT